MRVRVWDQGTWLYDENKTPIESTFPQDSVINLSITMQKKIDLNHQGLEEQILPTNEIPIKLTINMSLQRSQKERKLGTKKNNSAL